VRSETLLGAEALQRRAIFDSTNFSKLPPMQKASSKNLQCRRARMLGYTAEDVLKKITPADISDPQEVIARAEALSAELETQICAGVRSAGFQGLAGHEDIYRTHLYPQGRSRFPAVVSVHGAARLARCHHRLPVDWHRQYGPQTRRGASCAKSNERIAFATESVGIGTWEWTCEQHLLGQWLYQLYGISRKVGVDLCALWQAVCIRGSERCESELAAALRGERESIPSTGTRDRTRDCGT